MKRFLPLVAAFLFLTATPAAAKVIEAVELCGKSECRSLPKKELRGGHAHPWVFGGTPSGLVDADGPPSSAGRWRASIAIGDGHQGGPSETVHELVVPEARYLRVEGAWQRMSSAAAREWTRFADGIKPLPSPAPAAKDHTGADQADETSAAEPASPPVDEAGADQAAAGGTDAWPWIAVGVVGVAALLVLRRRRSTH